MEYHDGYAEACLRGHSAAWYYREVNTVNNNDYMNQIIKASLFVIISMP